MAMQIVTAAQPISIRRPRGSTVTFINQDAANDVWLSAERAELAASVTGIAPSGTKLAHGGTSLQYPNFPGVLWARSLVDMNQLEVLP